MTLFLDVITARRRTNRMDVAQINLVTKVGDCLEAFNLCCSTIRSAVISRFGTLTSSLYEACRDSVISLRGVEIMSALLIAPTLEYTKSSSPSW